MRIEVENLERLRDALERHIEKLGDAFAAASETVAATFIDRNDVFVPKETGALRNSAGYYQEGNGWGTETVVGYGFETTGSFYRVGRAVPQEPRVYAVDQEENYPRKRWPGTIVLYMQDGFDGYRQEALVTIIEELSSV
jgi:hypothetical protein